MGPDGDLYVAERFHQRVRRFSIKRKKKGTFIEGLPDMPAFLVHVPDRKQKIGRSRVWESAKSHSRSTIDPVPVGVGPGRLEQEA